MKKLKELVLTHPQLIPPEHKEDLTPQEFMVVKTEYDVVTTLKAMGHEVLILGVQYELRPIREAVESFHPDIVFNMLEEFHGEVLFDQIGGLHGPQLHVGDHLCDAHQSSIPMIGGTLNRPSSADGAAANTSSRSRHG